MPVTVTLPDGRTDRYMRFGDKYIKHHDGSLEVHRGGARHPLRYSADEWTAVDGDEQKWQKRGFRR